MGDRRKEPRRQLFPTARPLVLRDRACWPSMYWFVLRPKWVLSHLLVLALIAAMIWAGFWQLDRLDQRRTRNDEISSRLVEEVAPVSDLVAADDPVDIGSDIRFRLATASGVYVPADEVLILNRSFNGSPGYWAMTPLMLSDGTALVVNRGWVPFVPGPGVARPGTEPPVGTVEVAGLLRGTQIPQGLQSADPGGVVLDALARPDLDRLQEQLSYEILPVYLQLEAQNPPSGTLPIVLSRPSLGEGPHFAYAMQWFIFTIIALIGYPLVLRRVALSDGKDGRHSDIPVDYL